jgi:hypothetical protein
MGGRWSAETGIKRLGCLELDMWPVSSFFRKLFTNSMFRSIFENLFPRSVFFLPLYGEDASGCPLTPELFGECKRSSGERRAWLVSELALCVGQ